MRTFLIALCTLVSLVSATLAGDDFYGPFEPEGYPVLSQVAERQPAPKACEPDDARPGCHILKDAFILPPVAVEAATLNSQVSAGRAHRQRVLSEMTSSYGHPCNAPVQPVWVAEVCNAQAFGNPMGGKGGSD